ncbi:MAG TPA: M48 family metallopeptidase [Rhodocyclaceae bacterium]|nr:M48 family metallopeptidase [Rhodocyclaceae bacterium]
MRALPISMAITIALAGCQNVPITGRSQLQLVSAGQEASMGLSAYQEVLKKEKISHDPALNALVARVGSRIAAATGRDDYQWEFKVIENDKTVNAFCLPGGKVAVYTGLMPIAKDEAGLAAVIGHEVAHAIARHGAERVSQQLVLEGVTMAAVIAAGDQNKANLYGGLIGAGATLGVILPYSRLHESEADRMGLIYMARAGYDPHAALELWKRMAAQDKGKPPEFLSTHPADSTRIHQIEQALPEAMGYYRPVR